MKILEKAGKEELEEKQPADLIRFTETFLW